MESILKTYTYPDGTLQRVQLVRLPDWDSLDFLALQRCPEALDRFAGIYRQFLVPACPWLFGNMVMFCLPQDLESQVPLSREYPDPLTAAAAMLQKGVCFGRGKPRFRDDRAKALWEALQKQGCLTTVHGKLPVTTAIPVGNLPGFLSEAAEDFAMAVNAPFFIMDRFDCATFYDHVGKPLGLRVKNGVVLDPPLYEREALLVKADGSVVIEQPDIRDMDIRIEDTVYHHGRNARIYSRPQYCRSPWNAKTKLVITGCRVAAVLRGSAPVPASGFVLEVEHNCCVKAGMPVRYCGMEDVAFGIQVGNSIMRDGEKTRNFVSRFYNIRKLQPVPYPPSLYPMGFQKDRAARIALGADRAGKPLLAWVEGAPKLGYLPGSHSCGATLEDMANICADLGMIQAVNLDGGGSAQLLLHGKRRLQISDRTPEGNEAERPIPMGLIVK